MKKFLIIGASILQLPAIIEAKKMGLHVVTFDFDKKAPGYSIADEAYEISTIDINAAVKKAREIQPDGVMTLASDMPMRTVAAIAQELDLIAISEETAYIATNKAKMRQKLKDFMVPIPEFYTVNNKKMFDQSVKYFNGKFIVKPADNSGSRGVHMCNSNTNLDEIYYYSKKHSYSGEVLVEECMEGQEVSVETFAINGEVSIIAITDKITTGPPYFVEMGHAQPSQLSFSTQKKIHDVAISAVKALGIVNGPSHVEIIVTKDGPKIVELGARLGGDNISSSLVPLSTGVNLVKACITLAIGEEPNIKKKHDRAAVIRYYQCNEGKIASITGTEHLSKIKGVKEFKLLKNKGDIVFQIKNSNDRIGYVICEGETIDYALSQCEHAISAVKFDIKSI